MQFFAERGKDPFRLLPLVAATFPKGTAFGGGGKVSGRARGPILEGAVERSETGGVLLKTTRTSSEEPVRHGRGSKFRTHGTRFWRPLLYQLSYAPIINAHNAYLALWASALELLSRFELLTSSLPRMRSTN